MAAIVRSSIIGINDARIGRMKPNEEVSSVGIRDRSPGLAAIYASDKLIFPVVTGRDDNNLLLLPIRTHIADIHSPPVAHLFFQPAVAKCPATVGGDVEGVVVAEKG